MSTVRNVVVLGNQWGDEGKGKIVDLLTERAAAVVRFQGGHNAGHTLVIDGEKTDAAPDTRRASCVKRCSASSVMVWCWRPDALHQARKSPSSKSSGVPVSATACKI